MVPHPSENQTPQALTVSELNRRARVTIERQFNRVWVVGEMSNFARPRSGHWYFTLKDDRAQVRCAMFVNRNRLAQLQPSDGQLVTVQGRVSLYEGRGDFQIIVDRIEAAGEGALRKAFDALKAKLHAEGLFAEERKRAIPRFPRHCVIITSATGAALHDVLTVWRRRYPLLKATLFPVAVQGEQAVTDIVQALDRAGDVDCDVVLLTRGGGSLEDLWGFNAEPVARAVRACKVPVVSAVGHEIDITIADFVADLRAPTPSAAAELMVPDGQQLTHAFTALGRRLVSLWRACAQHQWLRLRHVSSRLVSPEQYLEQATLRIDLAYAALADTLNNKLTHDAHQLHGARIRLKAYGPQQQLQRADYELERLRERLAERFVQGLKSRRAGLTQAARMLTGVSPLSTLTRGYAVVTANGEVITQATDVSPGQNIQAFLRQGAVHARVESIDTDATLTPVPVAGDAHQSPTKSPRDEHS